MAGTYKMHPGDIEKLAFDFSTKNPIMLDGLTLTGTPILTQSIAAGMAPLGGTVLLTLGSPSIVVGSGAVGVAVLNASGGVDHVTVTAGGANYLPGTVIIFSGGAGAGAAGTVQTSEGAVVGVTITQPGVDYTSPPTVTFYCPSVMVQVSAPDGVNIGTASADGYKYTLRCRCAISDGVQFESVCGSIQVGECG